MKVVEQRKDITVDFPSSAVVACDGSIAGRPFRFEVALLGVAKVVGSTLLDAHGRVIPSSEFCGAPLKGLSAQHCRNDHYSFSVHGVEGPRLLVTMAGFS